MRDHGEGASQHERMILAQRQRVQEVRSEFIAEGVHGETTETGHLQLARVCAEYWQVLREYDDEAVLDDLPDIQPLREALGQKKPMLSQSAGLNRGASYKKRPAVLDISTDWLLDRLDKLDDAAKQLGFSASASDHTPVFGVDPEWEGGDDDDASPTPE